MLKILSAKHPMNLVSEKEGFDLICPKLEFCTDNGAMILMQGFKRLSMNCKYENDLDIKIYPRWSLDVS